MVKVNQKNKPPLSKQSHACGPLPNSLAAARKLLKIGLFRESAAGALWPDG
jgi:hypothetical protein